MGFSSRKSLALFFLSGVAVPLVSAFPELHLHGRRKASILNSPAAQPPLPAPAAAAQAAAQNSLNLSDIQGDILIGMKKKTELFIFFHINNATSFKTHLKAIYPIITSTTQLLNVATQPQTAVNIAFSQSGLNTLGVTDNLNDGFFAGGQFKDATNLGDPGTVNWVPALKGTDVHGVFILASDSAPNLNLQLANITTILGDSTSVKHTLPGSARPGPQEGHEHFGFMDGISQPAIQGFTANPLPGQTMLPPGSFLLGEDGDTPTRPAWTKGGSFLAFRQLEQLVPEFHKYLLDNAISRTDMTQQQGADLLGARMVGRWMSGAPVDLTPLQDDPVLAADPTRNNNFNFVHDGFNFTSDQTHCAFSAHIRKTRPRADLGIPEETFHHIIRAGIPYGPEVTDQEKAQNTTLTERGLAFVAYQSDIGNGFRFLQQSWADNPSFVFGKNDTTPGVDPIIGALAGASRVVSGLDPFDATHDLTMPDFIVSRGGEYFFSPPISALLTPLSV